MGAKFPLYQKPDRIQEIIRKMNPVILSLVEHKFLCSPSCKRNMVREGHQKGIRKNEGADGLLRLTLTKAVRLIASIDFERVNTVHIITHCKFIDKGGIKPKKCQGVPRCLDALDAPCPSWYYKI